ncbi:hypothetical protein Hanom_Chr06g00562101 [Helianthus anomalus]
MSNQPFILNLDCDHYICTMPDLVRLAFFLNAPIRAYVFILAFIPLNSYQAL